MAPRCSVPAFLCLHALAALRPPPIQPDSPTLPLLLRASAPARGRASASACRQRNTAVAARGGLGSAAPSGSWSRPCTRPTARGTASVAWPHGGCRHFALGPRGETEAGGSGPGAFADRSPEDLHIPVLAEEVAEVFRGVEGGIRHFIDGTVGMGGHSSGICRAHADTLERLMGIDQDPTALLMAGKRLGAFCAEGRAVLVSGNFEEMGRLAAANGLERGSVDGILLDIGTSSLQIDEAERGFSFMRDGPLDMRMDPGQALTAADIVNTWDEEEIARVIYEYGEERKSRSIARKIVAARLNKPIETTLELSRIIGGPRHGKGIHPATLAFQGLRIAVNRELHVLEQVLPQAVDLLRPGGRLAVISFHSLEDRIVKSWFLQVGSLARQKKNKYAQFSKVEEEGSDEWSPKGAAGAGAAGSDELIILTKRPIVAGEAEIRTNPRSRSAKLRVLQKGA